MNIREYRKKERRHMGRLTGVRHIFSYVLKEGCKDERSKNKVSSVREMLKKESEALYYLEKHKSFLMGSSRILAPL